MLYVYKAKTSSTLQIGMSNQQNYQLMISNNKKCRENIKITNTYNHQ